MREPPALSALLDHSRAVELARTWGCSNPVSPQAPRSTHPPVRSAATGRETITDDRIRRECSWSSTVTAGLPAPGTERQNRATRPMTAPSTAGAPPPLPRCSRFEPHGTPRPARRSPMPRASACESMTHDASSSGVSPPLATDPPTVLLSLRCSADAGVHCSGGYGDPRHRAARSASRTAGLPATIDR